MTISINLRFRTLAILTAAFIYLLIIAGGLVRATGSGLGCPDWPTCHGTLAPPVGRDITTIIEYTHRAVAGISSAALAITGVWAWWSYRRFRWITIPAALMLGLLVIEIGLGGVVVLSELEPLLVAIHLGIALTIFASTLAIAVYTTRPEDNVALAKGTSQQVQRLFITAIGLILVLMVGASVVGSNTSLACPDWPICNANRGVILFPPPGLDPRIWFHLAHRYTVTLFGLWLAWVVYRTLKEQGNVPAFRLWAILLGGLFVLQVVVGATQVLLQKPALLRVLHVAVASGVWASLVILTLLNVLGVRRAKQRTS